MMSYDLLFSGLILDDTHTDAIAAHILDPTLVRSRILVPSVQSTVAGEARVILPCPTAVVMAATG